jgi:putative transposase
MARKKAGTKGGSKRVSRVVTGAQTKTLPKGTYFLISNVGSEGRIIFSSKEDFDRFEAYLYLLNSVDSPRVANLFAGGREREIFTTARGEKLIAIGAYCFTPKEFHLLVTPVADGGISKFMQKLQTAYTMFFNHKYQRTGRLFHSAYRSRQAETEDELQFFFTSVHLNAIKLFNERWHELEKEELLSLAASAMNYRYSSIGEHRTNKSVITSRDTFPRNLFSIKNASAHVRLWSHGKGGKSNS